ncbi:hypothetical protein [Desulforhabdus sp. TSK]|nr:hypothetical protein [Desulforhabdus sp. TSK]
MGVNIAAVFMTVKHLSTYFLTFSYRHTGKSRYPENLPQGWIPAKSMPE